MAREDSRWAAGDKAQHGDTAYAPPAVLAPGRKWLWRGAPDASVCMMGPRGVGGMVSPMLSCQSAVTPSYQTTGTRRDGEGASIKHPRGCAPATTTNCRQ